MVWQPTPSAGRRAHRSHYALYQCSPPRRTRGGAPASKVCPAPGACERHTAHLILLDTGLVESFKAKAGERGYQTLINDTLRQARERENLEETLRRVIREELHRDPAQATPNKHV